MAAVHSFHIPVMGTGFTLDTPLKVAHLGIDSSISIVDDDLIEKIRKSYCEKLDLPYTAISEKIDDYRAKRITSYLNMINQLVQKKFHDLKSSALSTNEELRKYFRLLPENSSLKADFFKLWSKEKSLEVVKKWLLDNLSLGSVDVNIMTKLDKANFKKGEKLPAEYNDAHAALRGFAASDLESSVIFSAGMNPRLYSYLEKFEDFYPDENGRIRKKLILKVSDYRSALIQGKFLAKKGLWVSEYRVESGLNCGGHAFATEGFLLGPILEQFRANKEHMREELYAILSEALANKGKSIGTKFLTFKVTAQGGVGTKEEHEFLIDHYQLDSVGWGSPFLLVPEVTAVDQMTLQNLCAAEESDLYLSHISPLGVPFNNLRGNSKDIQKRASIEKGRPGSICRKKYLALNMSSKGENICTASRQFQRSRIKELQAEVISEDERAKKYSEIVEKSCLCTGLGASILQINSFQGGTAEGVSICPGPNLAYFSKIMSLEDITDHIYGRQNVLAEKERPHVFIKELLLYMDYLKKKLDEAMQLGIQQKEKYLKGFMENLTSGIEYYQQLLQQLPEKFQTGTRSMSRELDSNLDTLKGLKEQVRRALGDPVMFNKKS